MNFGLLSVNTTYELGSVFVSTTRIERPIYGSNWILPGYDSSEATIDRVSVTKAKNHYIFESGFETMRDKMVDQYFGRLNISMSQPHLDSTPLDTERTNVTLSPVDSIPVRTKMPEPTILKQPPDS